MPDAPSAYPLLPYSYIVGQEALCRILEVAYVAPAVGGVLVSGQRGTAKSTIVRSFARMMYGHMPVTLPINATDDRVIGGWRIDQLMRGKPVWQPGLLQQASESGVLYIDEVNLLDDHIVNLILDVVSTGWLTIQREGMDMQIPVALTLVATMNPEEGALRPQLLDRFGLLAPVTAAPHPLVRQEILRTVLCFDAERARPGSDWLAEGLARDQRRRQEINAARSRLPDVRLTDDVSALCAHIADEFKVAGHRGDIVLARGAQALAALDHRPVAEPSDVQVLAPAAIMHRRQDAAYSEGIDWTPDDDKRLADIVGKG
jgi:magnesium chelatase subunit I